ncbi:uncharacterized protein ACLA_091580 [Aspergillus clavatus NRRL 1]|uniref:Uncharacterized protein n=1 Tax=Aspergillus clavatus (strain ATCC 1007 / CBS 513.65 / DSM 816 / NCTC 3887 / NRRL 1 / QM 1276 / 107) TaxID=344612 RepID=A1CF11_ASPCL|nr:uncharacterized protein ACLA_091580 [Aspergillus clavatus NRRL 1]EAW11460.1 hypothetical protein ACLA_091580 [Aspergillus clavatus NRRL 1]
MRMNHECPKYQEEAEKVETSARYRKRYHRVPPYLQDFRQDSESSGSDSTAVLSATAPSTSPPEKVVQFKKSRGTAKKKQGLSKGSMTTQGSSKGSMTTEPRQTRSQARASTARTPVEGQASGN